MRSPARRFNWDSPASRRGFRFSRFGLFGGTLADFLDRQDYCSSLQLGNCLVAVTLGVLTLTGAIQVWHILVGTALTSALNIVLNPTRMSLISYLVPRSHLTNAVSLNSSVSQSSFLFRADGGGIEPGMDQHRQRLSVQRALLYSRVYRHFSAQSRQRESGRETIFARQHPRRP